MSEALSALSWGATLIYAAGCLIACAILWEDVVDAYHDWDNASACTRKGQNGRVVPDDYANLRRQMARTFLARLLTAPLIVVLWPLAAVVAGAYLVSRAIREAI